MRYVKLLGKVLPAVCVGAMLMSTVALGQTAKTMKSDTAQAAARAKQLKPQTTCPVMGGQIDKKLCVDYKGKRIYVCCPGCIDSVKNNPEKYIRKLEKMGQGVETIAEAPKKGERADTSAARPASPGVFRPADPVSR
jgi:YHS domain-containing protein